MDIIFIANKIDKTGGGSNFSLDLTAQRMLERGHDVKIVTLNITSQNNLPNNSTYEVIRRFTKKEELLSPNRFLKIFREFESDTDIYHVFSPIISPYAGYYRRKGGSVPVFCRMNQYRSLCSDVSKMDGECHNQCGVQKLFLHSKETFPNRVLRLPFYYLQSKKYTEWMNSADTHYAISPAVKDVFEGFGVDGNTIEVIPNFYDPDFATGDANPSSGTGNELLYVGRLSPEKGIDTLIQALTKVSANVSLRIVGSGPHQDELERQTTELGLDDRIIFCGHVDHDHLPSYYRSADVFIHPGRWPEPFGRTLLEAWQMNCAIIASDIGGPPWILGNAGLLFERNDASALAKQIDRCATNETLRTDLIQRGDARLEKFSPKTILDTIESQMLELSATQTT